MSRILCEDLCAKRRAETCRANLVNNMWVENLSGMIRKCIHGVSSCGVEKKLKRVLTVHRCDWTQL